MALGYLKSTPKHPYLVHRVLRAREELLEGVLKVPYVGTDKRDVK
jgi:hypothetical protein